MSYIVSSLIVTLLFLLRSSKLKLLWALRAERPFAAKTIEVLIMKSLYDMYITL